jgi:hypothetical protein
MKEQLDLEDIKDKLYQKLEKSGWAVKLRSFIYSSDFDNIIRQLARLSTDGKRFTPKLSQMFRAFEECPVDQLKVVVLGQDPYPQFGVADGIAFSCGNTKQAETSLKFMLEEVNRHVYKVGRTSQCPDTRISRLHKYTKGSEIYLILQCHVNDVSLIEKEILEDFCRKYDPGPDGSEDFIIPTAKELTEAKQTIFEVIQKYEKMRCITL